MAKTKVPPFKFDEHTVRDRSTFPVLLERVGDMSNRGKRLQQDSEWTRIEFYGKKCILQLTFTHLQYTESQLKYIRLVEKRSQKELMEVK